MWHVVDVSGAYHEPIVVEEFKELAGVSIDGSNDGEHVFDTSNDVDYAEKIELVGDSIDVSGIEELGSLEELRTESQDDDIIWTTKDEHECVNVLCLFDDDESKLDNKLNELVQDELSCGSMPQLMLVKDEEPSYGVVSCGLIPQLVILTQDEESNDELSCGSMPELTKVLDEESCDEWSFGTKPQLMRVKARGSDKSNGHEASEDGKVDCCEDDIGSAKVDERSVNVRTVGGTKVDEQSVKVRTVGGTKVDEQSVKVRSVGDANGDERNDKVREVGGMNVDARSATVRTVGGMSVDAQSVKKARTFGGMNALGERSVEKQTVGGMNVDERSVEAPTIDDVSVAKPRVEVREFDGVKVDQRTVDAVKLMNQASGERGTNPVKEGPKRIVRQHWSNLDSEVKTNCIGLECEEFQWLRVKDVVVVTQFQENESSENKPNVPRLAMKSSIDECELLQKIAKVSNPEVELIADLKPVQNLMFAKDFGESMWLEMKKPMILEVDNKRVVDVVGMHAV